MIRDVYIISDDLYQDARIMSEPLAPLLQTLARGVIEVDSYADIETDYLLDKEIGYYGCDLYRAFSIFGERHHGLPHDRVLIYIDIDGNIYVNPNAPDPWIDIFHTEGII